MDAVLELELPRSDVSVPSGRAARYLTWAGATQLEASGSKSRPGLSCSQGLSVGERGILQDLKWEWRVAKGIAAGLTLGML